MTIPLPTRRKQRSRSACRNRAQTSSFSSRVSSIDIASPRYYQRHLSLRLWIKVVSQNASLFLQARQAAAGVPFVGKVRGLGVHKVKTRKIYKARYSARIDRPPLFVRPLLRAHAFPPGSVGTISTKFATVRIVNDHLDPPPAQTLI